MNSDATPDRPAPPGVDSVRRQVVDVAAEMMRGAGAPGAGQGDASSAMNVYLALLTDRLPVYVRTMVSLESQVGRATVEQNLTPAAQATIQFYRQILAAKVSVFTRPDQLLQLRRVLKARGLGPHNAYVAVSYYLERERALGRIASDVDCTASAQLLIGACVNYAFTCMLLDDVTPAERFVEQAVRGLRLTP